MSQLHYETFYGILKRQLWQKYKACT